MNLHFQILVKSSPIPITNGAIVSEIYHIEHTCLASAFLTFVVNESGALKGVKVGGKTIGPVKATENYINRCILKDPKSMFSVLEPIEVHIFAECVVQKFLRMDGSFYY
jgi:hypothetical protein